MAENRSRGKKRSSGELFLGLAVTLLIIIIFAALCVGLIYVAGGFRRDASTSESSPAATAGDILSVHYINVGQADCILIECDGGTIMIDAGDNGDSQKIAAYLNEHNIQQLNYIIGTHAHADHIGGMDDIIMQYAVDEVILPTKPAETKTYDDVIDAAAAKNVPTRTASEGETVRAAGGVLTFVDDGSEIVDDMNNNSYVLRFTYGNRVFLFTGDAESEYEKEILAGGADVSADVLKVGHHGSSTSTCNEFLKAVSPDYAVIQVAAKNSYGHPSAELLDRLERFGVRILRNDTDGDIVFTTDGNSLSYAVAA